MNPMQSTLRLVALTLLTALPSASATRAADPYTARVVGVSDGDTLTVLKSDKTQVKIRLNGIDAPETGQDFGSRAKQRTSELAFGKTVTVRPHNTDRYGRTVAEILLPDGASLNQQLVRDGFAWWYRTYAPKDRELAGLEREAKDAKRGLWSQGEPIPPWEWRKGKRADAQVAPVGQVIGNRRSMAYHTPECRSVAKMAAGNVVKFGSVREAEEAGYKAAGDCVGKMRR
jgi:micrococcal nuclease